VISKIDCYKLLNEIQNSGIDIKDTLTELTNNVNVTKNIINFINKHRPQNIYLFYKELQHKNSKRKNKLYQNLLKDNNTETERLLSLTSYISQVFLFTEKMETVEKLKFYQQSNLTQCISALYNYVEKKDYSEILNIYDLISTDIKIFVYSEEV
jgi:hypothetical protein